MPDPTTSAHRQETDMPDTDTTERDQLAALLREHGTPIPDEGFPGDEYDCCADALLEAGVRPPTRVIETPEGVAALGTGTVIRSSHGDIGSVDHGGNGEWTGDRTVVHLLDFATASRVTVDEMTWPPLFGSFPWTVLFDPAEERGRE